MRKNRLASLSVLVTLGLVALPLSKCAFAQNADTLPQAADPAAAEAAAEQHGALAYSEATHRYGWAQGQPTQAAAKQSALSHCGAGCTVRLVWDGGCGAYAGGQDDTNFGWAAADDRASAEDEALRACSAAGGEGCTIRVWACN